MEDISDKVDSSQDELDYFLNAAKSFDETQNDRKKIKNKLMDIIEDMKINFDDKAMTNQVKVSVISTAASILNDMDNQVTSFEKLKLSKKENDGEKKYSELIVNFLNKMQHETPTKKAEKHDVPSDADMDRVFKEKCNEILPGEIE